MIRAIINIFATIFMSLSLASCTAQQEVEEPEQFIIPAAPETPRFMHLKTLRGEIDLEEKKEASLLDSVLGEGEILGSKNFVKPYGVAVYKGKIYVTDTGVGVVHVVDTQTKKVSYVGDKNKGKLSLPVGIAIDAKENIYVSDSKLQRVFGYDQTGELMFVLGNDDEFIRPTGIAINKDLEALYVVDTKGHTVRVFSLSGDFMFDIGQRGTDDGEFNFPTNIAIDPRSGNIIVVDTQNFRIQIFDQDGNHIKTFGNIGDVPGTFSRPKGVGIDSEGNIYISDAAFDNIQIFDKTGTKLLLYFGKSGDNPGEFQMPAGIYIDEKDRVYITENYSGKVQIIQYLSTQWKKENKEVYEALMQSRKIEE